MRTVLVVSGDQGLHGRLHAGLGGRSVFAVTSDEEGLRTLRMTAVDLIDGAIVDAPARYRPALTTLCFGLSSGAVARIVGGGWREVVAAALIGLALGSLGVLLSRWQSHIYEPTAALLATALAFALAGVLAPMSIPIVTLAGLIVLIPGLTLTVAMRELATRNLVAGTARLMGALLVFFEMGFGATLGGQIYRVLPPIDIAATPITLPGWTEWLAFVCSPISLMVLFRARPRDAGWVMFGCTASFLGSRFGSGALGPENGAFVGALALGVAGNLFTRLRNRPAAVMTVPGLMLLVPGSVGFTSLSHFLDRDVVTGVEAAFRMVIVAVALVTGLLVANVAIPPRRIL